MIEIYSKNSIDNDKAANVYGVDIYDIAYKRYCQTT